MTSYDAKGKVTSSVKQTVLEKNVQENKVELTVKMESFSAKGKAMEPKEYKVSCEEGVFKIDMSYFIDEEAMKNYRNMEATVEGNALDYPSSMRAGQTLPDGEIKISIGMGGINIMNMRVLISDRKVEGTESVTTPAGTFDCFKISYNIETKFGIKIERRAVEWIAKNVGVVRTESYKGDKLEARTELTRLEK